LVVILRKTYDTDLALTGMADENVDIYSQAKDYTDLPILFTWITDLFLLEAVRRREAMGY
jgi:hypothetical protein